MRAIMFGSAILTMLTAVKAVFPQELSFLPLGGSSIAEMGVILGLSVAISAIANLIGGRDDKN